MISSPIVTLKKGHPLHEKLLQWLPDVLSKLEKNKQRKPSHEFPKVDWAALTRDYNSLASGEALAFLVVHKTRPTYLSQAFTRRGLRKKEDYLFYSMHVLSIESADMIGKAPTAEITESEFMDYACLSGKQYPDPEKHPNITAMDQAIPRRSNRFFTSDTLPILKYVWQVYLIKTSNKKLEEVGVVGRPKK